jgi:hypothetical protein
LPLLDRFDSLLLAVLEPLIEGLGITPPRTPTTPTAPTAAAPPPTAPTAPTAAATVPVPPEELVICETRPASGKEAKAGELRYGREHLYLRNRVYHR